jgi:Ca2+-dependent lipid-binding protein
MITIHHAVGLSAQDDNGFSDPYVVIAYSKFGKPVRPLLFSILM